MHHYTKKIVLVEDGLDFSSALLDLFNSVSLGVLHYVSVEALMKDDPQDIACIVSDIRLPGMSGLQLQKALLDAGSKVPFIVISGHADIDMSVWAMKMGAHDFFTKPLRNQALLDSIFDAVKSEQAAAYHHAELADYTDLLQQLTERELEVLRLIAKGLSSKGIAGQLDICKNTLDVHRANLMKKMQANSLGDLVAKAVHFKAVDVSGDFFEAS